MTATGRLASFRHRREPTTDSGWKAAVKLLSTQGEHSSGEEKVIIAAAILMVAQGPNADDSAILSAYLSNVIATQPDVPNDRIICVDERYIEDTPDWHLSLARKLDKGESERETFKSLRNKPKLRAVSEELLSFSMLKLRTVSQNAVAGPECSTRPRHTISRPIMYKNKAFLVSHVGRPPCAAYTIISRIDKIGASWKVVATKGLYAAIPSIGCGQLWTPEELNNIKGRYYLIGD